MSYAYLKIRFHIVFIYKHYTIKKGDNMKKYLTVAIPLILLMVACILLFTVFRNDPKPIPTIEERIKELNAYVNNSLSASDNMYLKIYSSKNLITIQEFPALKNITSDLTRSIKIKEEYKTDIFVFNIPHRVYFCWDDIKIILDIDNNLPNNLIYIEYKAIYYKAEASTNSIHQLAEFVANVK